MKIIFSLPLVGLLLVFLTTGVTAQEEAATAAADASPSAQFQLELPPPASGFKLTVSPPVLDLRTDPGASVSADVMIKSFSGETEAIRIDLMKFKADESGNRPVLEELSSSDQFPQWVSFSEQRFLLEPETWKRLTVTFNPPISASPAYYFAIVFNREKEVEFVNGQVTKGAAAILVLSQIASSRVYHQLDLAQLDGGGVGFTTDKNIYEFLPVTFNTTITNNGNVHELAYGNIFVDWVTGGKRDIATIDVNKEGSFTLPQTTRSFSSVWSEGFPVWEVQLDASGNPILDKDGQPMKKLKWNLENVLWFRIGKYKATLVMIYNDGIRDIPIEAETEFWVIPWRILLALLVVLIILGIGLKGTIQSVWRKIKEARDYARYKRTPPPSV